MPVSSKDLEKQMSLRGTTWTLNLRSKRYPEHLRRRITLYEPGSSPAWPEEGRSTNDQEVAKSWLPRYAAWINQEMQQSSVQSSAQSGPLYVGGVAKEYIAHLEKTKGPDHNTTANRRSAVTNHIIPGLGHLLTSVLESPVVQRFFDGLEVTKRKHGKVSREPAMLTTKQAVRDTLREMWRWKYKTNPPFSDVRLRDERRQQDVRVALVEGRFDDIFERGSYTPSEIERVLVRAMMIDLMRRPNVARSNTPYTATAIALQYGFATRIAEFTLMRWRCIEESAGLVLVPGSKNRNALRWMIVFDTVWPWIEEARRLAGGATGEMDWLLRVDPRAGGEKRRPAVSTLQNRINAVLEAEGLKTAGKCTHILRASCITTLTAEGMSIQKTKVIVGHAAVGGATEQYLKRPELLQMIQPQDRHYLASLPHPDTVREKALEALERLGLVPNTM